MKRLLLILTVLGACARPNDNVALRDEAIATSHFYKDVVEALNKRGGDIVTRSGKVPNVQSAPGAQQARDAIQTAGTTLGTLRGMVEEGADHKSQIEKQAEQLFKDGKTAELQKLISESNESLEVGTREVASALNVFEAWVDGLEKQTAVVATAPTTPPSADAAGMAQ
ncbi:MAG: hypothetical protein QM831_00830 [Kofleriaceae bacterium]